VNETVIDRAAEALGGADALNALRSEKITTNGSRFVVGQGVTPEENPAYELPPFEYTFSHDIESDRMRIDWTRYSISTVPGAEPTRYAEVIVGDGGFVDGNDAYNIPNQPPQTAMLSNRVAAVRKMQRVFSPHLLVRSALENPDQVTELDGVDIDGKAHEVVSLGGEVHPVRLYIDAETSLPSKIEVLEDDPVIGDNLTEIALSDYRAVGDVKFPHAIELTAHGGIPMHAETRATIETNVDLEDSLFAIPAGLETAKSEEFFVQGDARAQWYHHFLGYTWNVDDYYLAPATFTEVVAGSGVYHVTGGFHHSMVVELDASLVVVEAPMDEFRSKVVLAEIEKRFPSKPITHVINTHFHDDHSGGVRSFAAKDAKVVTAERNKAFFETLLAAPHTVIPDALQQAPRPFQIETVGAVVPHVITEGTRTVELYPVTTTHCEGMLVAYIPHAKVVFTADLYNPGFFPAGQVQEPYLSMAKELYNALVEKQLVVDFIAGGHGVGVADFAAFKLDAGF